MVAFTKAVFISLGLSATGHAFQPVLLADTNRDGVVDKNDGVKEKETWKPELGAIFMANIGDTGQRCLGIQGAAVQDKIFNECNDATGDDQRNPKYMARMWIPPAGELPQGKPVFASIEITGEQEQVDLAREYIRIFKLKPNGNENNGADWKIIKLVPETEHFTGAELAEGIQLGIDARDFAGHDSKWEGLVTLTLNTFQGEEYLNTDDIQLRVAPLLTHHSLQPLELVYTVAGTEVGQDLRAKQQVFADTVAKHSSDAQTPVTVVNDNNRWIQDWFESGYTSIPGKGGKPEVLRVFIRGARIRNPHDRRVFTEMRSDTVGAVQVLFPEEYADDKKEDLGGLEAMGNLETIPPYIVGKNSYPNGRPIVGRKGKTMPRVFDLLKAQGTDPVALDIAWLRIGHIDEVVQFLPWKKSDKNPFGWVAAFVDPRAGIAVLKDQTDRPKTAAMSREDIEKQLGPPKTVADLFYERDLDSVAELAGQELDAMISDFLTQTGLPKEMIIRIPTVFHKMPPGDELWAKTMFNKPQSAKTRRYVNADNDIEAGINATETVEGNSGSIERRMQELGINFLQAASLYANSVNGLLLNNKYLFPTPYGPVGKDNRDVLAKATVDKLNEGGIASDSMEDWWTHHVLHGEVHCGTNTLRDATQPWWPTWEQRAATAKMNMNEGPTTHTTTTTTSTSTTNNEGTAGDTGNTGDTGESSHS